MSPNLLYPAVRLSPRQRMLIGSGFLGGFDIASPMMDFVGLDVLRGWMCFGCEVISRKEGERSGK